MHRIQTNDLNCLYSFMYEKYNERSRRILTTCKMIIQNRNTGTEFVTYGKTLTSPKDNFVRKIGMINSFSRALNNAIQDRNVRREIFREFWRNHGRKINGDKWARVV